MFELHTIYRFQTPAGQISERGISEITRYIRTQNLQDGDWKAANPDNRAALLPELPDEWRWQWLVSEKGDYVGTFPKRVSKYYHKTVGLKCPDTFVMQIGNLAKAHSDTRDSYAFDFVDEIDWEPGDFGDYGSCWWGSYAGAKVMLIDNGGMAMRFFDANEQGFGRAWLAPIGDMLYILFNGYGFSGDATLIIARVFALFTGLQYKSIDLEDRSGEMSINNGGMGYVIGLSEVIESMTRYVIHWPGVHIETCSSCGCELYQDDVYYGADDMPYCWDCYRELFQVCDVCGRDRFREDMNFVESQNKDVCDHCLSRFYTHCTRCDELFEKSEMERFGAALACPECASELKIEGDNIE